MICINWDYIIQFVLNPEMLNFQIGESNIGNMSFSFQETSC